MAVADVLLPADSVFSFQADRPGPFRAADFETWPQDEANPMELVEGWVLPMSPGTYTTGKRLPELFSALEPLVRQREWDMTMDARHRLPKPPETVVFPDLAIHCVARPELAVGTETVNRVPDVVIELLSEATAERDLPPRGAKFLAYQLSGVREYYCAWPDGRAAWGFERRGEELVALAQDEEGFFASPLLGARLRLVPARIA